jgi:hypothetical protein
MPAQSASIIQKAEDVRPALSLLGLSEEKVIQIAQAASYARAEYLPGIDPVNAPGTKAYQAGIRQLRLSMLPDGWKPERFNNIEVIVNHELGLMLGFQNVDRACEKSDPSSISDRGEGTRQLVAKPYEAALFNQASLQNQKTHKGAFPLVWFVCVAADQDKIQVEVSRPKPFEGTQFNGFFERIFVADQKIEAPMAAPRLEPEEEDDHEIVITKKQNDRS